MRENGKTGELLYWVSLSQQKGLSCAAAVRYYDFFGSVSRMAHASREELAQAENAGLARLPRLLENRQQAEKILGRCRDTGVKVLSYDMDEYPEILRNIYNPPLVLYVKGKLPDADERLCIGVVGTRRAGKYGLETAREIGGGLALAGAVTVTGAAEGIDSAASRGALENGGEVVAVLGTAIDQIYPAANHRLYADIERSGALVSEYPPGARTSRASFPMRNRIISGISQGVAVVEAPAKSGSLITAACAAEQGRDVFAVPGRVDDAGFEGSNRLIRDGAQLIRGAEDIIEEYRGKYALRPVQRTAERTENVGYTTKKDVDKKKRLEYSDLKQAPEGRDELENRMIAAVMSGKNHADQLIAETGAEAGEVMSRLTMMTIRGILAMRPDGGYELLIK